MKTIEKNKGELGNKIQEFKEELLFNKYKDTKICNSDYLRYLTALQKINDFLQIKLYSEIFVR